MDNRDTILLRKILSEAVIIDGLIQGFDCDSLLYDVAYGRYMGNS